MNNQLSIQDILDKANNQTKRFIKELEEEENIERVESIDTIRNDIKAVRKNTELKKEQFIKELKSGLGQKVKENPNKVIIVKKSLGQKIKLFFKKLFTKF